jgi:hypothetical protein
MEWMKQAQRDEGDEQQVASEIDKMVETANNAVPKAMEAAERAKQAALKASAEEANVRLLLKNVRKIARGAAQGMVPGLIEKLKKKAREKAKEEAQKEAKATEKKMKKDAKEAGAKAMVPYNEALSRAAATAAEYAKRGDAMTAQSASIQMDATMAQQQANQWLQLGDTAKAQGLMQQSRQMMNIATGLNAQAGAFYNNAQSIMGTLPAYTNEAGMAAYHAEVMLNPDAPPPPPPLVF